MSKELENKSLKWTKEIFKLIEKVGLNLRNIKEMSINMIKNKVNEWDENLWKTAMESKSSLDFYRSHKTKINEEKWFRNGTKYEIMMKTRSKSLKIGKRDWENQNSICELCGEEEETTEHFIFICNKLDKSRCQFLQLQKPINSVSNNINLLKRILLFEKDVEFNEDYYINLVFKLWTCRAQIINDNK